MSYQSDVFIVKTQQRKCCAGFLPEQEKIQTLTFCKNESGPPSIYFRVESRCTNPACSKSKVLGEMRRTQKCCWSFSSTNFERNPSSEVSFAKAFLLLVFCRRSPKGNCSANRDGLPGLVVCKTLLRSDKLRFYKTLFPGWVSWIMSRLLVPRQAFCCRGLCLCFHYKKTHAQGVVKQSLRWCVRTSNVF